MVVCCAGKPKLRFKLDFSTEEKKYLQGFFVVLRTRVLLVGNAKALSFQFLSEQVYFVEEYDEGLKNTRYNFIFDCSLQERELIVLVS